MKNSFGPFFHHLPKKVLGSFIGFFIGSSMAALASSFISARTGLSGITVFSAITGSIGPFLFLRAACLIFSYLSLAANSSFFWAASAISANLSSSLP